MYFNQIILITKLNQKGEIMEPRIIELNEMKAVGMTVRTTVVENKIPNLWDKFMKRTSEIKNVNDKEICLGICFHDEMDGCSEDSMFTYMASKLVDKISDVPDNMLSRELSAETYAVFTHKGALDNLDKTYNKIYAEWLPQCNYKTAEADEFEWYDHRFKFGQEDSEMFIYVPVVKK